MLIVETRNTNMAEENHKDAKFEQFGSDDMSVMRVLMHTVKGISAISGTPALDFAELE